MKEKLALIRLLQLSSPALPVGAYTYSQGLEWAVESGAVTDEKTAFAWISGLLKHGVGLLEAPLLVRLHAAWRAKNITEVVRLNAIFLASRETAELRAETVQMGFSLRRLATELPGIGPSICFTDLNEVAYPTAWSAVAAAWEIPSSLALTSYLWSWCENQVMAAIKIVPLGHSAGQRLLVLIGEVIPEVTNNAHALGEQGWSNFSPGLAIASCRHETQYSRLFRS